ncbi:unnamed protein product [Dovyalis caffra]|uniref:2Fe-2S ferredoxin-type domain-containing protein n=1 Tax=Dovyalis caffra TaxID=77055 RepID=A0AAV1RE11_9ROSI|nr:unnamed protein product [Dovyalis caffra]
MLGKEDPRKKHFPILEDHPVGKQHAQETVETFGTVTNNIKKLIKEFKIYRWSPDNPNQKQNLHSYFIEISKCGPMVLDVLQKIKAEDDATLAYRRSCREGICGSCAMNIDGTNTVACLTPIDADTSKATIITPLPHAFAIKDPAVDLTNFYQRSIEPWLKTTKAPEDGREYRQKEARWIITLHKLFSSIPFLSILPPFPILRRLGPSKRVQSSNFSKSTRQNHRKPDGRPVPQVQVEPLSPRSYIIPAAILGFAGLAAFVHYNDERRAVPKGQGSNSVNVKGPTIGGPFTLINTENKLVTEKDFLGNWVLLYFGYTSSPDVGPEQLKVMAKAINTLESKENLKVLPLFVTLDPQRDNPSHLRAYLKEFEPRIVGLTGPVGAIRQMAQEYRVYFRKVEEEGDDYLVESSHNMYLINPNMEVVRCFGVEYNAEELSEAIRKELKRTSA